MIAAPLTLVAAASHSPPVKAVVAAAGPALVGQPFATAVGAGFASPMKEAAVELSGGMKKAGEALLAGMIKPFATLGTILGVSGLAMAYIGRPPRR